MNFSKKEVWKDISQYTGHYQASNWGRIRSIKFNKILVRKLTPGRNSYLMVSLSINNKIKTHSAHRLVLKTFKSNPKNLPQCNHIDGDRQNNKIGNLEWSDNSSNGKHSYKYLNRKPVISNNKLTVRDVLKIRELYFMHGYPVKIISNEYNVHNSTIYRIIKNQRWAFI